MNFSKVAQNDAKSLNISIHFFSFCTLYSSLIFMIDYIFNSVKLFI